MIRGSRVLLVTLALASTLAAQCENAQLSAFDGASSDQYGRVVAVSGDRLVVGSSLDDDRGSSSGSVYVYEANGMSWALSAKLVASDGASSDQFGTSVDIEGSTLVVGSPFDDDKGSSSGAAYVFELQGGNWVQTGKLVPADGGASDNFGIDVAVSGDTIAVGAYQDDDAATNAGAVYTFDKVGTSWVEAQKLVPSDGASSDNFGKALSLDATTMVVGSIFDDDKGSSSGSVYVYTRVGPTWSQNQKLTASDGASSDNFGVTVDVAANTIVVGSYLDDDKGSSSGSAYVFTRTTGPFSQVAKLLASDGSSSDYFGWSVGVSSDESYLVVGAYRDDPQGNDSGSCYLFQRVGATYSESAKLISSDGKASDNFAFGTSIDLDRVVVGAYLADPVGSSSGQVYAYSASGLLCPTLTATPNALSVSSGGTQTLSLNAGPGWGNSWYWLLGSATGITPGIPLGSIVIPLNFDAWFNFTALQPNQGPLGMTVGTLDASSQATATITIAAGTSVTLVGLHVDHAYVLWDPFSGSLLFASNTRGLDLTN